MRKGAWETGERRHGGNTREEDSRESSDEASGAGRELIGRTSILVCVCVCVSVCVDEHVNVLILIMRGYTACAVISPRIPKPRTTR